MKRRILLSMSLAFATSTALSALAADQPYAGQHLTVLMEGHPTTDGIQKLLPEFTKETGIKVEY